MWLISEEKRFLEIHREALLCAPLSDVSLVKVSVHSISPFPIAFTFTVNILLFFLLAVSYFLSAQLRLTYIYYSRF